MPVTTRAFTEHVSGMADDAAKMFGQWKCAMVAALDLQLMIQDGQSDSQIADAHRATINLCNPVLAPELRQVVDRWREALGRVDWDYVMGRR